MVLVSAHDRHLAAYRTGFEEVWCTNPECPNHTQGVTVRWTSEYGQSWWEPEECHACTKGEWTQDRPEVDA